MDPNYQRKVTAVTVLTLIAIVGTTLLTGTAPSAEATQEPAEIDSCTTISETGTYELTADVEDSDDDRCIAIETGDVTLDGNGHLVDGVDDDDTFGVYVDADSGGPITVRNLTVRDWEEGVRIVSGETTVSGVEATSNEDGLNARRLVDGVRFENVHAHDNHDDGIEAIRVTEFFVVDSRATNNDGDGIYLDDADDGDIRNNVVEDNEDNGIKGFDPDTMDITENEIHGNDEDGIHVHAEGASGALAEDMHIGSNEIENNGDEGIHLTGLTRIGGITNNTVCDNDDKQFLLEDIPNVQMTGNTISC